MLERSTRFCNPGEEQFHVMLTEAKTTQLDYHLDKIDSQTQNNLSKFDIHDPNYIILKLRLNWQC